MLQDNLGLARSDALPSVVALIPLVVFLGERPDEQLAAPDADALLYWLLLATIFARYSGSTDTVLGQDIPAARAPDPIRILLGNVGAAEGRVTITPEALCGRGRESPYFFLSLLAAKANDARDWWYGTVINPGREDGQRIEYHHIHPVATLTGSYPKAEINDLANLAFISAKANRKISDRKPATYFPELGEAELAAHFVPLDVELRDPSGYRPFLAQRRELLAGAMTVLLDRYRPDWVDTTSTRPPAPTDGMELSLTLYESGWDTGRLVLSASGKEIDWRGTVAMAELEAAVESAGEGGIDADVEIAGEMVPVRLVEDAIEISMGPFLVTGTLTEWRHTLERERVEARPLSRCPPVEAALWAGERIRFPVTSTE